MSDSSLSLYNLYSLSFNQGPTLSQPLRIIFSLTQSNLTYLLSGICFANQICTSNLEDSRDKFLTLYFT